MASSQVEVASSAPFGCVLRDHTRRNGCRDNNPKAAQDTLHKNLKNLVRNHLHDGITVSSDYARHDNNHDLDRVHNQCQPADSWSAPQAEEQRGQQGAVSIPAYDSSMSACFNDISELGASSLVQIWEKRLTRSNSNKTNSASPTSTSSPGACINEEESRASETEERGNEHQGDGNTEHQSHHSTQSEAEKLERVRVAEIIRRLSGSSGESNHDVEHSYACMLDQQVEQRMFTPSLRLRGRQAFNDLIMQMERDRNDELEVLSKRAAVSKFTHRGRIQAMLRLKLLQRGVAFYDPPYQHPPRASCVNKAPHSQSCGTITHLRERFNAGSDHGNKVKSTESSNANQKRSAGETRNNPTQPNSFRGDDSQREDNGQSDGDDKGEGNPPYTNQGRNTSNSTKSKARMVKESLSRNRVLDLYEYVENNVRTSVFSKSSVDPSNATWTTQAEASLGTSIDLPAENAKATRNGAVPNNLEQKKAADEATPSTDGCDGNGGTYTQQEVNGRISHQYGESNYHEMTDEIEESYGYEGETSNYDWISNISRPRSFWESRRQEWYREMLSACSDNDQDLRQLIERRTVSNFLSSDLRERMDQFMVCHLERQSIMMENGESDAESMGQFTEFIHEYSPSAVHHEQDDRAENKEQEQRQEEEHKHDLELSLSSSQGQNHDISDDFDQSVSSPHMPSPSLVRSWSYRDNDPGEDSDRPSPQCCHTFYDNSPRKSPSNNHISVEMELIYDLRFQMEQLHREMAELRKSIKSSMDLQNCFKDSMNPDVHSVKREASEAKEESCRVCHEMKVDTVLYRCGHMCACVKCANELQWSSGKCPVCRAAIVDVIRVHVDV